MTCEDYKTCPIAKKYRAGLETRDKYELNHFLTICKTGKKEDCQLVHKINIEEAEE